MKFSYQDHRITATTNGQWAGEISFPAVPGSTNHVVVERTFVVPKFRHQGLGSQLVQQFVQTACQANWVVKLMCPFAKQEFVKHPNYQQCLLPADRLD